MRLKLKAARLDEHGLTAEVVATDGPFGNLVTNLTPTIFWSSADQRGQEVPVEVGGEEMKMKFVRAGSAMCARGRPLLYVDSRGHLGLAVDQGRFCRGIWGEAAGGVGRSAAGK